MTGLATVPGLAALWLLAAASLAAPAEGAALGILVMAEHSGQQGTVGPALDVIAVELRRHGHRVEMVTGAASSGVTELTSRARARAGAPVDAVVIVKAVSQTRQGAYTRRVAVSLSARIVGVTAGRELERLPGAAPPPRRLPEGCGGPCAERRRAILAEAGARELAPRLAARIGALGLVPARLIRLRGFAAPARAELMAYLRRLPGTRAVAAPETTGAGLNLRYVGTLGPAGLRRAMAKALNHADIAATLAIAGPFVTITKGPRPPGGAAGWRNW